MDLESLHSGIRSFIWVRRACSRCENGVVERGWCAELETYFKDAQKTIKRRKGLWTN